MTLKTLALSTLLLLAAWAADARKVKVIAHRGYWDTENSARNSISSLRNAIRIGVYGTEFDVTMTSDSILMIHHDPKTANGLLIEATSFADLRERAPKLANGELIPTLEDYLTAWDHKPVKLILEIKSHSTPELETTVVEQILRVLDDYNVRDKEVEFISFSYHACKEVKRLRPTARVTPLTAEHSFEEMKRDGMNGVDFHYTHFRKHPEWIDAARRNKMTINVWTINTEDVMREMIGLGVDYITTDKPLLLEQVMRTKAR